MSHFPVIRKLSSQTSKAVIEQLKSIFAEYGVPDTLITDNGPCYDSKEFKSFTQKYNFEHVTSSPHYHEGNGLAEKYVDIIKNQLQKALDSKEDPYKSMLIYQTTPLNSQLPSPMEMLNKCTYTDLPISNLRRSMICNDHTNINLRNQRKSDPKVQTRQPAPLPKGTPVMVCNTNTKTWFPATIRSPRSEPNSYDIVSSEGITYRRSWHHLKPYLPRLPKHDKEDNTSTQEGENQSQTTSEAQPHHSRKPVHRYIEEM